MGPSPPANISLTFSSQTPIRRFATKVSPSDRRLSIIMFLIFLEIKNSKLRRYEDGRKLRRYKRRWIIERTNAWLGQFRRLLVRHEHLLSTYRAFFYLACLWITLRRCL